MRISAKEFVRQYCQNAGWTEKEFYETQVPMPDDTSPYGWAAVSNDYLSIKSHVEIHLSNPIGSEWISVDERLPEEGEVVAVAWGKQYQGEEPTYLDASFDHIRNEWVIYFDGYPEEVEKITHWSPAPEAPQQEVNNAAS